MSVVLAESLDEGRILLLRLNRPKANILDAEMIAALGRALEEGHRPHTRAVVIGHEGPHFSFGASVEEHRAERAAGMLAAFHGLFRRLHALGTPLLAAARGQCLGGGLELAAFCHLLFAGEDAAFAQPEIRLGVFPPMASLVFALRAPALADEINLSGRSFSAAEFQRAGLACQVAADPQAAALAYAREHLLPRSASSLRLAARASRWAWERALAEELPRLERLYLETLMATHDANEGIASFLEKRPPAWRDA
jgi:cyclohexa-1,5-dienecarbonyl-CoA hydratase